jgi:hypothetical protein
MHVGISADPFRLPFPDCLGCIAVIGFVGISHALLSDAGKQSELLQSDFRAFLLYSFATNTILSLLISERACQKIWTSFVTPTPHSRPDILDISSNTGDIREEFCTNALDGHCCDVGERRLLRLLCVKQWLSL